MNPRQVKIRRAVLLALEAIPAGLLLPDDMLRAEAARLVVPRPTGAELDRELLEAERARQMTGVYSDEGTKWKLADPGRAWLAEHL
jgi:hypothetical protein